MAGMERQIRTDLASEARSLYGAAGEIEGVAAREETRGGFKVTTVDVLDERGADALCKPIGKYVTLELDRLLRREENAFTDAAELLARELAAMLQLPQGETVLVAALGNSAITPDAVGPLALENIMVTRHLIKNMPEDFAAFRPVAAVEAGVLGTTGFESAEMVSAVCEKLRPAAVLALDALCSASTERLCRTVQLADTGITPGSGVGNSRAALNRDFLGVPVIAVGVPTVVDAVTLAVDIARRAGVELMSPGATGMIVTPRDIDKSVRDISKLVGYGIDLALHPGLTVADVDMFLS